MAEAAPTIEDVMEVLGALENRRLYNRLDYYQPYEFQLAFHHAKGKKTKHIADQRALMCANQIGKTTCGAYEVAIHATGRYPDWWQGHRFTHPIRVICGSNTNEQTRDNVQGELLGDPTDDKLMGTGTIPKECVGNMTRKPGIPNAYDSVSVSHASGGISTIFFRCYEQGEKKHMGGRYDLAWADEEPPQKIFSQWIRSTLATAGIIMLTFTPEEGITEVVHSFITDLKVGQALVTATWDDAPHMTPERRERALAQFPAHERAMRSRGIPTMGSGLIFPVKDEDIMVSPFPIPDHWPRLVGLDFGWEHPAGAVWQAWDRETDTVYFYHAFRKAMALTAVVCEAVKHNAPWIPVAWPHDGMAKDKASGRPLADLYRDRGVNMLVKCFSNPPQPGKEEGTGGQGVEVGLLAMLNAMEEGRLKVFSNLTEWFEEKNLYHRKEGQVVALRDDLMSASRYAYQSRRFSATKPVKKRRVVTHRGLRNWG